MLAYPAFVLPGCLCGEHADLPTDAAALLAARAKAAGPSLGFQLSTFRVQGEGGGSTTAAILHERRPEFLPTDFHLYAPVRPGHHHPAQPPAVPGRRLAPWQARVRAGRGAWIVFLCARPARSCLRALAPRGDRRLRGDSAAAAGQSAGQLRQRRWP